jgi:hypothetical protein
MKTINGIVLALLVLTGISQTRCSDDSTDRPVAYEFKVTKIECATDVYLGHPLSVDVTITSNDEAENVPIDMYLAKHNVADDEEVPFHSAGSYIIPTVRSGENTYSIKVTVPTNEIPVVAGDEFRIAATVDPALSISKERPECVPSGDTEADHSKECFSEDTTKVVTINSTYNSKQDLLIDNIALTTDVVTIDTGDTIPDFITGTMTVKSVAIETLNVPVRFVLNIGGTDYPLMIWDTEIEGYSKDYWIGQLRANDPKSIPFFLDVDSTTAALLASGPNSVTLTAIIDPDNKVSEAVIPGINGEANNTLTRSLTIVKETTSGGSGSMMSCAQEPSSSQIAPEDPQFDITGTGLGFSKYYSQTLGNSLFGARPFFSTWASLNEDGAEGYAGGGVAVSIFNASFNFVYMEASAAAVPHMLSSSYVDIYLKFAWMVLYSFHVDGEYSWDKDWTVYKSKGYTATFWAGPIPLNVSAGAQGTMGFAVSFGVGDNLEATASEFASAGAYASASVGIPGLLEGGVKGNLNIVSYETKAVITAGLQLSAGAKQIQGWLQEQVITTLAGPNGSLNLFAKYPYQRWCRWWGIYYPCGWPTIKEVQTPLVTFSSWSKEFELMNLKQDSPWMNTGL